MWRALGLSLLGLIGLTLLFNAFHVDVGLADALYVMQGGRWQLKDAWVTSVLVHQGAKYLSACLLVAVLLALLLSYRLPAWGRWRGVFVYVVLSFAVGTMLVSWGKSISHVSCPWDFSRYGGPAQYLPLLEQLWVRDGLNCFPAGHASTGFGWVCLYFVGRAMHSPWRWVGLAFAVVFGLVCGISQQLRGAHFLSHDLWSFGVCWLVAQAGYYGLLHQRGGQ